MHRVFRFILLSILIFLLSACVFYRDKLQEGIQSFCDQDYRQAFVILKPFAENGNPEAMYAIGYMYYYGEGVVEDRKKACVWISRAARAGHQKAIRAIKIINDLSPVLLEKKTPYNTGTLGLYGPTTVPKP